MNPPEPNPDALYGEEKDSMDALLRGIKLAVKQELNNPGRSITRTEQEKLCYFGIKKFDIPITYSWYLAGAYTRVAGEPDNHSRGVETGPSGSVRDRGESETVLRYRDYFASEMFFDDYDLQKIWYTGRFEFLRDFYREYSPDEYTDLYLASTNIRECLNNLSTVADQDTQNMSLANWNAGSEMSLVSKKEEEELRLYVSDLHIELGQIEELSEMIGVLSSGTDIVEQVVAQLTTTDSVSGEQETILRDLEPYFYYDVWRYPALYISTQTAVGPNRHHLVDEHTKRFLNFHEELSSKRDALRQRCTEAGLYPEIGHHSRTVDDDQAAYLHDRIRGVLEGTDE